jgi:hypothetical protein
MHCAEAGRTVQRFAPSEDELSKAIRIGLSGRVALNSQQVVQYILFS